MAPSLRRTTTTCATKIPRPGRFRSPAETEVIWYPTGDPTSEVTVTFADWVEGANSRGLFFGVWLDVIDGEVFRVREQWVP